MTIEEIKTLIKRKQDDAKRASEGNYGCNTESWSSYYYGIAYGLHIAEEIIGMLDKPNRISNNENRSQV